MEPIKKTSVIESVIKTLKEHIISGTVQVGSKLPAEKDLCQQLHVGRSTIREAFRALQAMGFVEMKPGRGAFVATIKESDPESTVNWFVENESEISNFMEARMAIETLAIRLVIERATDKEIQTIEHAFNKFEEASINGESDLFYYYDEHFHSNIVKATHNDLLIAINKNLSNALRTYRIKTYTLKGHAENALITHREILRVIKEKDVEKAISVMNTHINNAMKDVSEYLLKEKSDKDRKTIQSVDF